jgi:hypothetical protein
VKIIYHQAAQTDLIRQFGYYLAHRDVCTAITARLRESD